MGLNVKLYHALGVIFSGSPEDGRTTHELDTSDLRRPLEWLNGSSAGQASKYWEDSSTIAASGSDTVDLSPTLATSPGALIDPLGNLVTFTVIKGIVIEADAGNTNDVVVGGAASNAFLGAFGDATDKIKIRPGGVFVMADPKGAGWAVTADTADQLLIGNSGGTTTVTYKIRIWG